MASLARYGKYPQDAKVPFLPSLVSHPLPRTLPTTPFTALDIKFELGQMLAQMGQVVDENDLSEIIRKVTFLRENKCTLA